MTKEALKLALEALKDNQHLVADNERHAYVMEYNGIIEKCEEALAQPEQERPQNCGTGYCSCIECVMEPEQEPVAAVQHWCTYCQGYNAHNCQFNTQLPRVHTYTSSHTTPPQRTWVGLTDRERMMCRSYDIDEAIANTEAKLKEKNT